MKLVHLALPQQVSVWRPGPPHSPLAGTHFGCSTHFMTPFPMKLVHLALPQQVSVWRPGPPHSPLAGTHFGCSTHFMTPFPMKLVHLAVPQQVSVWRPGPPHSPLLGTHCSSELKSVKSSKFELPSKLVAPPWLAPSSSAN